MLVLTFDICWVGIDFRTSLCSSYSSKCLISTIDKTNDQYYFSQNFTYVFLNPFILTGFNVHLIVHEDKLVAKPNGLLFPQNTKHRPIVGLIMGHRLRRWPNIKQTFGGCLVPVGFIAPGSITLLVFLKLRIHNCPSTHAS